MKNPKEEAVELFNSMKGFRVKHSHSNKCAKIAVNKILEEIPLYDFGQPNTVAQRTEYWKEVLIELEKI